MLSNREKSHICRYRHLSTYPRLCLRVLCASAFSAFQFLSSDNSPSHQSESSPASTWIAGEARAGVHPCSIPGFLALMPKPISASISGPPQNTLNTGKTATLLTKKSPKPRNCQNAPLDAQLLNSKPCPNNQSGCCHADFFNTTPVLLTSNIVKFFTKIRDQREQTTSTER